MELSRGGGSWRSGSAGHREFCCWLGLVGAGLSCLLQAKLQRVAQGRCDGVSLYGLRKRHRIDVREPAAHHDLGVGKPPPQPPDGESQMRRIAVDKRGHAHESNPGGLQSKQIGGRKGGRACDARAQPMLHRSCASMVAAASSRAVRPATQSTGASPRQPGARSLLAGQGDRRPRPCAVSTAAAASASCVHRRRCGLPVLLVVQFVDQLADGSFDLFDAWRRRATPVDVVLRKLQALERDLVVIGRERLLLQKFLGLIERLGRVSRQHALIENFRRRQSGPVAEHHVEELQTLDVPAEHHEAYRQRRRKDEADRAPQRRPERCGSTTATGDRPVLWP